MPKSTHERTEIPDLVVRFFESIGALVEFTEYSLADVVLPEEYARHFDGRTFLRITFDYEVAQENPDAEFITYGSYFTNKIAELATGRGLAAMRHLIVDHLQPARVEEKVTEQFNFIGCKVKLEGSFVRNFHYVLFNFKIAHLTDEREDAFESILINMNTNRPAKQLEQVLDQVFSEERRSIICPEMPLHPMEAVYRTACLELRQRAEVDFESHRMENRRRLAEDLRRINAYYDDLRAELEERLRKGKGEEEKILTLRRKIEANERERARRASELEDKYRLRIDVKLNNAALYIQPKTLCVLRLSRRQEEAELPVVWDPLLKRFEPPICEVCGEELRTIQIEGNGSITCWGKGPAFRTPLR